jgi:hypothetical protein
MKLGRSTCGIRLFAVGAALVVTLALPALATARITVPPGATEGDQYFEEVPNGGGSASANGGGGGGAGGGPPVAATQHLNALGADGAAAAALANANRPPEGSGPQKGNATSSASSTPSSTQGEGGMGVFFPLLLIGSVLAAAAFLVRRGLTPA